jgi:hypothetical protein
MKHEVRSRNPKQNVTHLVTHLVMLGECGFHLGPGADSKRDTIRTLSKPELHTGGLACAPSGAESALESIWLPHESMYAQQFDYKGETAG